MENVNPILRWSRDFEKQLSKLILDRKEELIKEVLSKIVPTIKEPITADKLKRRGIKLIYRINYTTKEYDWWIEQRGKRVSPKYDLYCNLID